MKIMILANSDIGLYHFRKELIETLLQSHEVSIASPNGDFIKEFESIGCRYFETPIDRRGMNPKQDVRLLKLYFDLLKNEKPDMVITYTIKPNIYGGVACRWLKIPYAVNITGLGTAFENEGFLKQMVKWLYKISSRRAKVVFFENQSNNDFFVKNGMIDQEQAFTLNGAGVNLKKYSLKPYPQKDNVKFLFMGRVMAEKGIDELFLAMDRLSREGFDCELNVVGEYEEDYQQQMINYEKAGWLKYHGFQQDVKPFIEMCHVGILPSWHEGMANVNLEVSAMGRPIITTDIPGCREAVEDGVSGLLTKKQDAEDLYLKMKKFVQLTNEQMEKMGQFARKRMENNFDKKIIVNQTVKEIFK